MINKYLALILVVSMLPTFVNAADGCELGSDPNLFNLGIFS